MEVLLDLKKKKRKEKVITPILTLVSVWNRLMFLYEVNLKQ